MIEVRLNVRRILGYLAAAITVLAVLGVSVAWSKYRLSHGHLFGFSELFDLDGEGNAPSWFESLLFLFASAQLFLIACAKRSAADRWAAYWGSLSLVFVALSADEVASVHEKSSVLLKDFLRIQGGYFYFAWIILGAVFVLALSAVYLRFFLHLPGRTQRGTVIAGALFVAGALVIESFEGQRVAFLGQTDWTYSLLVALEETLEMAGLWYWIRTLFFVMQDHEPSRDLNFTLRLQ